MDKAPIIVALAEWTKREIAPKFAPLSPEQIAVFTFANLASRNPDAAAAIAPAVPGFGQLAAPLLGAAGEYFDDVSETLVKTLRDNGGVRLVLNGRPYIVSGDDVERIVADIRMEAAKRAQKKEDEEAK